MNLIKLKAKNNFYFRKKIYFSNAVLRTFLARYRYRDQTLH